MIVRSIDVNGDWNFGKGRNDYLSANDAVAQVIATSLRSFLGDCFFAVLDGIDWFNLLGGKDEKGIILSVKTEIINIPEVTQLIDLSVNLDDARNISLEYSASTVFTTNEPLTQTVTVI